MLFIGVLPLLSTKSNRRAAIGILFSIISLAVYGELEPHQLQTNRILARTAQYTVFVTFGCGERSRPTLLMLLTFYLIAKTHNQKTIAALAIDTKIIKHANEFSVGVVLLITNLLVIGLVLVMAGRRHLAEEAEREARAASRAIKMEWACHFNAEKFATTFDAVGLHPNHNPNNPNPKPKPSVRRGGPSP